MNQFDWQEYLKSNPDLTEAGIDNELDAQKIKRIRELKKDLEEELLDSKIEEFEFNTSCLDFISSNV